ncbi:ABC transporter substrate-binding protein [Klebsiella pneumoniae subsp. pneumoniae]|nr:ABC transporter substrate-binding protein [Klebsiella pneumoniae subsp. pneumoniae]
MPTSSQAWNPSPLKTAELIQADMAQIGVKVIIVPVEGRFREARLMDMSHDLTLSGWATDSNDPDSFFRPLPSCAAIASQTNFAHWCNREFDDVLQKRCSQQLSSPDGRVTKRRSGSSPANCRSCRWPRRCGCRPTAMI